LTRDISQRFYTRPNQIERRDRALVAFTALTGARAGAIASLKLKHVDIDQGRVDQDARQVKTKFSKSFITWFFGDPTFFARISQ
jgi:integrase